MSEFRILTVTESNGHVFIERDYVRELDFECAVNGELSIRSNVTSRDVFWVRRSLDDIMNKYHHHQWGDCHLYIVTNIYEFRKVELVIDYYMRGKAKTVRYNDYYE